MLYFSIVVTKILDIYTSLGEGDSSLALRMTELMISSLETVTRIVKKYIAIGMSRAGITELINGRELLFHYKIVKV